MSTSLVGPWLRGGVFAAVVFAAACSSSPKGSGGSAGAGAGGGIDGNAGASGVTSQTVGTQGGTVTLDGVTLTIPGNALSADIVVTVSTATAPAGYIIASAAYQLAPADATFAQAVSVTIPLTMTAPHAHLFLSNDSGGFEDRGGIVSGPILTGHVTHFGTCFAATPSNDGGTLDVADAKDGSSGSAGNGAAGAAGTAGNGAAGAGTAGAAGAGTAGSGAAGAGTAGAGTAGSGTAGAGTAGAGTAGAGTAGAGGQNDAGPDAADTGDGGTDVASSQLCAATGINAPVVTVTTITDDTPVPAGSTYTGGTITSGKYYLTAVTHYGLQYGGPQKSVRTFDTTAQTLRTVDSPFLQGTVLYNAFGISNADDHTLSGDVICSSTQAATTSWYYTVSGTTITMSQAGSYDVAVYTAGL